MTDEEVLEVLKQVGIVGKNYTGTGDSMGKFIAFARLVAKQQREIDAEICQSKYPHFDGSLHPCFLDADECAAAILAQED